MQCLATRPSCNSAARPSCAAAVAHPSCTAAVQHPQHGCSLHALFQSSFVYMYVDAASLYSAPSGRLDHSSCSTRLRTFSALAPLLYGTCASIYAQSVLLHTYTVGVQVAGVMYRSSRSGTNWLGAATKWHHCCMQGCMCVCVYVRYARSTTATGRSR